jgi:hypothetical protein
MSFMKAAGLEIANEKRNCGNTIESRTHLYPEVVAVQILLLRKHFQWFQDLG